MRHVGVLTVSDRAASGEYEDRSGPAVENLITARLSWEVVARQVVADEVDDIVAALTRMADDESVDLIVTTGGTGFAPRDVTPEATRRVLEREAPGLAEAMRAASLRATPHAMLSRAVCGIRGKTLIVNLPGSPRSVLENFEVLIPVLPHALDLITDTPDSELGHRLMHA